ncbi:MAG TPA: maleylpyruvate isomerase N-terminal domain-containing protein [Thermodesulfobacteriota bacterium]
MRGTWLEAAGVARGLLAAPETAARWDAPSALAEFTVRGLSGHLARAVLVVESYLDAPPPSARPIPAAAYFPTVLTTRDLADPVHVGIRARGEALAADGPAALVAAVDAALARLRTRLPAEPRDRLVAVTGGHVMRLDDYLVTRMVEITVHTDDLAVSLGLATPDWPRAVSDAVVDHLVAAARHRHGDLAVIRALARRERDAVDALRVF